MIILCKKMFWDVIIYIHIYIYIYIYIQSPTHTHIHTVIPTAKFKHWILNLHRTKAVLVIRGKSDYCILVQLLCTIVSYIRFMNTPSETELHIVRWCLPVSQFLFPPGTFPTVFQLFTKPTVVDTFLENKLLPSGLKLQSIQPYR